MIIQCCEDEEQKIDIVLKLELVLTWSVVTFCYWQLQMCDPAYVLGFEKWPEWTPNWIALV